MSLVDLIESFLEIEIVYQLPKVLTNYNSSTGTGYVFKWDVQVQIPLPEPWLVLLTQDLWCLSPKLPTKRLTNCPNCADLKLHGLETLKAWRRWIKHGEKLLRYPFLSTKHMYNFNPQKFIYRNGRNEFLGCVNIKYMRWWKNWSDPMRRPFWIKLDGWG